MEQPIVDASKPLQLNESKTSILQHAWNLFDLYDKNSAEQQTLYKRIQLIILILGIALTVLVLSQSQVELLSNDNIKSEQNGTKNLLSSNDTVKSEQNGTKNLLSYLKYIIIILPITISIFVAAGTYFKHGNKWVALRSASESIKSEIYQYLTKVGKYRPSSDDKKDDENVPLPQVSPEEKLSNEIERINNQVLETEVSLLSLKQVEKVDESEADKEDGEIRKCNFISPEQYIDARITEQINWYRSKNEKFDFRLKIFQWLIFITGGTGTFIAAIEFELWVALTSSILTVLAVYVQYNQLENIIMKYNQASAYLDNIRIWWSSLEQEEKKKQTNIEKLITNAEKVMQAEHSTWQQNMRKAVSDIHKVESKEEKPK